MNNQQLYSRTQLLKGNITETFVRWLMQEKGFKLTKTTKQRRNQYNRITNYLNRYMIMRCVLNYYDGDKDRIIKLMQENIKGLPDFICLKDNKISFIEVKSNGSSMSDNQVEVISKLISKGYPVDIKRIYVNLELRELD